MTFHEALNISPGLTAIIGGGGKTSLLLRLGRELAGEFRVALCTTTRIYPPRGIFTLHMADEAAARRALDLHRLVCFGEPAGDKLMCPAMGVLPLAAAADYVLIEADGSAQLPLKAHAPHEPVIPAGADTVYVIGGDGIGRPVSLAAHRPELYARMLGADLSHIVTPEDAASMVDHGEKVLFNKAESREAILYGRRFAARFKGRTVIASLMEGRVISIHDNDQILYTEDTANDL